MNTLASWWNSMDRHDRYMLLSSFFFPLLVWWFVIGRHKYSTKGMR